MASDRVWFVAERFELIRDLLFSQGYALDPGPRDPSEWHELAREDPPAGLVRIKGVRLADPEDQDGDFDSSTATTRTTTAPTSAGTSIPAGIRRSPTISTRQAPNTPTKQASRSHPRGRSQCSRSGSAFTAAPSPPASAVADLERP
jgi:hypothetical protein